MRSRRIEGRVARRHALHAGACVAMAIGAGLIRAAGFAVPEGLAVEHPQHAGIDGVVVLHGARLAPHELVAGLAVGRRDFGERRNGCDGRKDDESGGLHSTVMVACSVTGLPLSSVHVNAIGPLVVATVKNEMNGLALIAGNSSARKISAPS